MLGHTLTPAIGHRNGHQNGGWMGPSSGRLERGHAGHDLVRVRRHRRAGCPGPSDRFNGSCMKVIRGMAVRDDCLDLAALEEAGADVDLGKGADLRYGGH
jgi:hypothetical protein